jgi:hypothetical protein
MGQGSFSRRTLVSNPRLLISESAAEFESMCAELNKDIRPQGYIVQMLTQDLAYTLWDILRWQRCRTGIINTGFRIGLRKLLEELVRDYVLSPDELASSWIADPKAKKFDELASGWFTDPKAKKEVLEILGRYGLDEFAIEAEAMRHRLQELEMIERLLASAEARLEKTLRMIAECRPNLAQALRETSDRMIANDALSGGNHIERRITCSSVTMGNERQIAANRRNAAKSTGPRSRGGKQRARRNAYCHGLSVPMAMDAALASKLDTRALKIVCESLHRGGRNAFALARAVAYAEFDLARARQAKLLVIERMRAFGDADHAALLRAATRQLCSTRDRGGRLPSIDPAEAMPTEEPEQTAEAIRRALPELLKLDRYERRACARRDRAVRDLNQR